MDAKESLRDLLLKFWSLSARETGNDAVILEGTVKVHEKPQRLKLHCPCFPLTKNCTFYLRNGIEEQKIAVDEDKHPNVADLLAQLDYYVANNALKSPDSQVTLITTNVYADLLKLHEQRSYKLELDGRFTRLKLSLLGQLDHHGHHFLDVDLRTLRVCEHSLPECLNLANMHDQRTLIGLVESFQHNLQQLAPFYYCLDNFDEICHVLQPKLPTTKLNWRLIMLRERVFLKITINNPFDPTGSVVLKLIGPTYDVEPLRQKLSEGLKNWDPDCELHVNLLRIFDLCYFPMPPKDRDNEYCNICYAYQHDNGDVPIVSCDNKQCTLIFHAVCLREWFNMLTEGKTFLNVSLGVCPHCKSKLSTSFSDILDD